MEVDSEAALAAVNAARAEKLAYTQILDTLRWVDLMRITRGIPALSYLIWATVAVIGCGGSEPAGPSFEVSFESMARSAQAVRVEVYLVDSCEDVTLGTRPVPAVASAYVRRDKAGALGEVEPGNYGLYGVAQDADCAVVAAGCAPVTIAGAEDTVAVTLTGLQSEGCPIDLDCSLDTGECTDGTGGTGGAGGDPLVRVDAGLILLYAFDEGSGSTVVDQSGVAPALDLTIADPGNVTWADDHLTINSGTTLSTAGAATKVFSAVEPKNEMTVEAWVKPASLVPGGVPPDRIISMSASSSRRNFLLGQDAATYAVRFRTAEQNNGEPTVSTTPASATTLLTHVVYTHESDGKEIIYIDGVEDTTFTRSGDAHTWDSSHPIVVANEVGGGREWLGELHLIAVYDRALRADQVQQNFTAGP